MKCMIEVFILCVVLVLLVTLYRTFAFENGMPTCKNYVANVFLYVAAVLVSVAIPTFIVKRNRYLKRYRRRFIERPLSLLIVVLLVYLLLVWSYAKLVEIPSSDFLREDTLHSCHRSHSGICVISLYRAE